jgi:pyruvate kinase
MLARIAMEVEPCIQFVNYPPNRSDETAAITEALNAIDSAIDLQCIVALTETGHTAELASEERPSTPIVAYTPNPKTYHRLSLNWGVRPVLKALPQASLETLLPHLEADLLQRQFVEVGDKVLVIGGIPMGHSGGTNFLKIHTIAPSA